MTNGAYMVDPLDVIRKSRRFDLIFKVELADAWGRGDVATIRRAEEAYLEMVRARNGFYERNPPKHTPSDFIDGFRKVAASIHQRGYDCRLEPIPLDADGEVLNGAHRLAACAAYRRPCPVITSERRSTGGSRYEAFLHGKIHPAVACWGMRAYLRRFPDGCLANEFATKVGPDMPFPDWMIHARSLRLDSFLWRLRAGAYLIKVALRFGIRREKTLQKVDACRQHAGASFMLAHYWEEQRIAAEEREGAYG